ncbi:alpha/beta hydrolase family protein [Microbacterium sp. MC2]
MDTVAVELPSGEVAVPVAYEPADDAWAALALAHGAGAGKDHPFLVGFAEGIRAVGVSTLRFDFPYVVAGRRMPGPAAHALRTWRAVFADLAARSPGLPLVAAGKSYGGRMASMTTAEAGMAPAALVYLGYPLHPPGKPESSRAAHLPHITAPQLFVTGTNDPFVQPLSQLEEAVASCPDAEISWITGGGHSFEVKGARRPAAAIGAALAPRVAEWLRERVGQRPAA